MYILVFIPHADVTMAALQCCLVVRTQERIHYWEVVGKLRKWKQIGLTSRKAHTKWLPPSSIA